MAKDNNLTDFLTDVADAIREKKGTTEAINPQDFSAEIASIKSGGNGWTGHADAEGLRAIGWTEEDIAYYQENGVDWNEEDDHLHLVPEDNKELYGILTLRNISSYRDRIVYLPKIDTSKETSLNAVFGYCYNMVAVPFMNTSKVSNMSNLFRFCPKLRCVHPLDTSAVTAMTSMFRGCTSLPFISRLDTSNVTAMNYTFAGCSSLSSVAFTDTSKCQTIESIFSNCVSLRDISGLNISNVTTLRNAFYDCPSLTDLPDLDTSNATVMTDAFYKCSKLEYISLLDVSKVTSIGSLLTNCFLLTNVKIKGLQLSINVAETNLLSKESLLYLLNNESATSPITVKVSEILYNKYANDSDVVEALSNHPNITLAK